MPRIQFDSLDKKILSMLSENARIPFLEIARECGVSGAAIHQRIQKLMNSGIIHWPMIRPKTSQRLFIPAITINPDTATPQ